MNMNFTSGLLGAAALLMASQANAATVQIDPASFDATLGTTFDLTVEGVGFTEATMGGGFELHWDAAVLNLTSSEADIVSSLGLNGFDSAALVGGVNIDLTGGVLQVAAGKFFELPVAGDFAITLLGFEALNPGTGITPTDLGIFALQPNWLGVDGITPLVEQPNYVGATVTVGAVPVPAAVWLFGSGLIGLVGIARRRSSAPA